MFGVAGGGGGESTNSVSNSTKNQSINWSPLKKKKKTPKDGRRRLTRRCCYISQGKRSHSSGSARLSGQKLAACARRRSDSEPLEL